MGRGGRRWIAVSGGVLINGLILAALVLVEQAPPLVDDPPVIVLELERPERAPHRRSSPARGGPSAPRAAAQSSAQVSAEGAPAATDPSDVAPPVDPAWRVDPKAVERWRLTEGDPNFGWGRFYRACKGLSDEHMTADEKERCYGGWSKRKDRRPSPQFIGPIDETRWETPGPKIAPDAHEVRKQRCRDYRRGRTPGFSERNLSSTGGSPPSLRDGGCF